MLRPRFRPSKPNPKPDPDPKMQPLSINPFQFKQNSSNSINSRSNSFSKTLKPKTRSNLLPILLLSVLFSVILYILFVFFRHKTVENGRKFGVVIDGGSTGTRIHVFEYRVDGNGVPRFDFGENGHWSMRVNPGFSAYEGDPGKAGGSVAGLVEFAKKRVPREAWGRSEIRLMSTAGMRLVKEEKREMILESCRNALRASGFRFRDEWALVISGADEGLYAWVVANYALGTLGRDPQQTVGIIELGGASAQVTFVSNESVPHEFFRTFTYGNFNYSLYTNSLLHYGQNVAFDSLKRLLVSTSPKLSTGSLEKELILDPCTPKGYSEEANLFNVSPDRQAETYSSSFHATGNFSECRAAALTLLQNNKEDCPYQHCNFGATFMPKLKGRFLATENFFHTSQFFGLTPKSLLSEMMMAGQQFCEDNWTNIRRKHSSLEPKEILHYCFSSAYIVAFLHDSLGVALDDGRIEYTNQVNNIPLDWALGSFILQTTGLIAKESHGWIASLFGDHISNPSLLACAAVLLFLVGFYVLWWRKPYFKTIYDLEKGRYIVTRISR